MWLHRVNVCGNLFFFYDVMLELVRKYFCVYFAGKLVKFILVSSAADNSSHDWIEGLAISIGVLVIVLVSAANDYGKERQFQVLQSKVREEHRISVIRNGIAVAIPVQDLVVGDLCQLKYGN